MIKIYIIVVLPIILCGREISSCSGRTQPEFILERVLHWIYGPER
jgi:hypothetical protein